MGGWASDDLKDRPNDDPLRTTGMKMRKAAELRREGKHAEADALVEAARKQAQEASFLSKIDGADTN